MIRQRALAWAAVLALVATVQTAPLPLATRFSASVAALAQDDSAADAGEPTDLAIVALHCAEAPATEALTSYFASATPPTRCAPAVGVAIAVTENGAPVSGSPFTTDVAGTLAVPVGLGAAVEVREDPKSLPAGYESLTQEANGVSYANPVQIDPAVAGAAVLFVNVPAPSPPRWPRTRPSPRRVSRPTWRWWRCSAPRARDGGAHVVLQQWDAAERVRAGRGGDRRRYGEREVALRQPVPDRHGRHRRGPRRPGFRGHGQGRPEVAAVRVRAPHPGGQRRSLRQPGTTRPGGGGSRRALRQCAGLGMPPRWTGRDAIRPTPTSARASHRGGRSLSHVLSPTSATSPSSPPTPGDWTPTVMALAASPVRPVVERSSPAAAPISTPVAAPFAAPPPPEPANLPSLTAASVPAQASGTCLARAAAATTGSSQPADRTSTGNVAIVSNPVFIGNGLWSWPHRFGQDDWFWQSRNHDGIWFRPNRISVGNLTIASSGNGNGNIAIVSNPIFIGSGVWHWPDRTHGDDWGWRNHPGNAGWLWLNRISVGNLTVASSGNGNVAIVSNPVFIGHGFWGWPGHTHDDGWFWPDRDRDDDWMRHGRFGNGVWGWPDRIAIGNVTVARSGNGNVAVVSNPVFIGNGVWSWPNRHGNDDWFWPSTISVGNLTIASSGNATATSLLSATPSSSAGASGTGPATSTRTASGSGPTAATTAIGAGPIRSAMACGSGPASSASVTSRSLALAMAISPSSATPSSSAAVSGSCPTTATMMTTGSDHGDRDHADDQHMHGGVAQTDSSDVEPLTINGGGASEAPPSKIEQLGASEQPTQTVNGGLAVEPPPADSIQPASDSSMESSAELDQPPSDGDVALASDGYVESPGDGTVTAPPDAAVQPAPDAAAPDPNYVAPDASIDPSYADAGNVDPGYVAPDPGMDRLRLRSRRDPGSVDAGYVDPSYVAPEPSYVEPTMSSPATSIPATSILATSRPIPASNPASARRNPTLSIPASMLATSHPTGYRNQLRRCRQRRAQSRHGCRQ